MNAVIDLQITRLIEDRDEARRVARLFRDAYIGATGIIDRLTKSETAEPPALPWEETS